MELELTSNATMNQLMQIGMSHWILWEGWVFIAVNNKNVWFFDIQVTGMKPRTEPPKQTLTDTLKINGRRYALGNPWGFSDNLGEDTENLLLS